MIEELLAVVERAVRARDDVGLEALLSTCDARTRAVLESHARSVAMADAAAAKAPAAPPPPAAPGVAGVVHHAAKVPAPTNARGTTAMHHPVSRAPAAQHAVSHHGPRSSGSTGRASSSSGGGIAVTVEHFDAAAVRAMREARHGVAPSLEGARGPDVAPVAPSLEGARGPDVAPVAPSLDGARGPDAAPVQLEDHQAAQLEAPAADAPVQLELHKRGKQGKQGR